MLRTQIQDAYKDALRAKEQKVVGTLRLIQAALKDRDIAARPKGVTDGIGEDEIRDMLVKMIKQRRESITLYEQGGRADLVQQEQDEIAVIERFLPQQMDEAGVAAAVDAVVGEIGATSVKDMGRCMAVLKERHAGSMDFAKAGALLKQRLGG